METKAQTDARIAREDDLLIAADRILADAGVIWNEDPERYGDLKHAILAAARRYALDYAKAVTK